MGITLDKIKPSKVVIVEVLVKDYHLDVGQIIKCYWNKDKKKYVTICMDVDQNGKQYIGNWGLFKENIKIIKLGLDK